MFMNVVLAVITLALLPLAIYVIGMFVIYLMGGTTKVIEFSSTFDLKRLFSPSSLFRSTRKPR